MEDVVFSETELNFVDYDIDRKVEVYCFEKVEVILEKVGRMKLLIENDSFDRY